MKKSNSLQKTIVPQKQKLLSRKKGEFSGRPLLNGLPDNRSKIYELQSKTSIPIDAKADIFVSNRYILSDMHRSDGYNVVDIAKTWTRYQRKLHNERTRTEHLMALTRAKAILALENISKKLKDLSIQPDYTPPPLNRRMATLTKPTRLPFI